MKGCVISAPMSGSGKTTVTLGLLAALRKRGIRVQPFKVGPDFIDPGLHEIASGVPSHNLDGWMLSHDVNDQLFAAAMTNEDVAVVEGVMGLFDGFDGKSERGSTAEMAHWLDLPVILVIDVHVMARSVAAMINGFRSFDPRIKFAGVIFNRVASERHYRILEDAVTDLPILGWLPADSSIEIPERHLGLFTAKEDVVVECIDRMREFFEEHIDVDVVLRAMESSDGSPPQLRRGEPRQSRGWGGVGQENQFLDQHHPGASRHPSSAEEGSLRFPLRVAIAHDKAFSFYYHANRMALESAGAQIIEFSPISASEVPDANLLYIGGGYPELYRTELEANASMRASVRRFIESGGNFYAECGGLMYLSESIDGARMVGIIPVRIEMTDRLVDFGYCEIRTNSRSILGPAGTTARGHQFHYSRALGKGGEAYTVQQGSRTYPEGFVFPNGIASYVHLHFLSNPALARNMLNS